jgi:hypothetical protein
MRISSPTHLDFSHGSSLAERLNWTRFQLQDLELVWHPRVAYGEEGPSSLFSLLVSFSRFRFRLSPDSVGACLEAILGGSSKLFTIIQLDDQIFRFSVSCKKVGFTIL